MNSDLPFIINVNNLDTGSFFYRGFAYYIYSYEWEVAMKKVLVTGGAGFIGSHISDLLSEQGYKVIIIDNLSNSTTKYINKRVTYYLEDILSDKVEEIIKKEEPEILIHTAAQINVRQSIQDPLYDANNNVLGTIRLLEYSRRYNVRKFIFSSSAAVYGETQDISIKEDYPVQPLSFYGASKYAAELYIMLYGKQHNLPYTILRYSNVFGPRQSIGGEGGVIATFCNSFLNQQTPSIFGDGEQTRDFVYVKDVARANLAVIEHGNNRVFNISTNRKTSINKLFQTLTKLTSLKAAPLYKQKQSGDIQFSCLDNSAAINHLGWNPAYSFEKGLEETLTYYRGSL